MFIVSYIYIYIYIYCYKHNKHQFISSAFLTLGRTVMLEEGKCYLSDTSLLKQSEFTRNIREKKNFRDSTKDMITEVKNKRDSLTKKNERLRPAEGPPFYYILLNFVVVCSAFSCLPFSFGVMIYESAWFLHLFYCQIHAACNFLDWLCSITFWIKNSEVSSLLFIAFLVLYVIVIAACHCL